MTQKYMCANIFDIAGNQIILHPFGPHKIPLVPLPLYLISRTGLADEDTNSILTDNAKRAIQGIEAMQVMQTGDQCKFATYASGAIWWLSLQLMQTKYYPD